MKHVSILLLFVSASSWSGTYQSMPVENARYDLSVPCQTFVQRLFDEREAASQPAGCSKQYSTYLYQVVSPVKDAANTDPQREPIPGFGHTLQFGELCFQTLEMEHRAVVQAAITLRPRADRAAATIPKLKEPHPNGGIMLNSTVGAEMVQEGLADASDSQIGAKKCVDDAVALKGKIPVIPTSCVLMPRSNFNMPYTGNQAVAFQNRQHILQNYIISPVAALHRRLDALRGNVVDTEGDCKLTQSIASKAEEGLNQAQVVADQTIKPQNEDGTNSGSTASNENQTPPNNGPITTQPAKRGLFEKAKGLSGGQAIPAALGAMMAGVGAAIQPKSNSGEEAKPQQQQPAPQQDTPKAPTASVTPPETETDDTTATEEPKVANGSSDVTKQDAMVKLSSGKITKKQILDKDGNVIGEETIAHGPDGKEVVKGTGDEETEVASTAGTGALGSSGADAPLGAAGTGAETSGVALASGSTGGGGRALSNVSSDGSFSGASPYGGGFHPGSGGGGLSSGQGAPTTASTPVDYNYMGASSAGGSDSASGGVQTVAARKGRRPSNLPICGANSKVNGMACQPIQKLRDDRAEREKGRINSDPNLNVESGRTRKR